MTDRSDEQALWRHQWELFHSAAELSAIERKGFLDTNCPDAEMRRAVEELLKVHDTGSGPLNEPLNVALLNGGADFPTEQATLMQETAPTLPPGRLLAGRFEIKRLLGQGGMGSVYEAHDRELDTLVALKMLRPEVSQSPSTHQRFRREIQLARQVTHPNVCRIFDLFQDGALSFLTMELLQGETMRQRTKDQGALSTEEALPWVEQICAGLSAAHKVGIIHRDLKTANIMLVESGDTTRVVITDFGLARGTHEDETDSDQLTITGQMLGTPAYMSPEQLQGEVVTPATDIYSLGVVLFELVTGRLPLEGETPYSIVARRLREPAPSPCIHLPGLDRTWERVILRCLERDPRERPRDPESVAAALRGEAVSERWPPRKRRRMALTLAAVASLAALAISFGPWIPSRNSRAVSEATTQARPEWLLIADFDNRTGEAILDDTLESALKRELVGSSVVNIVSRERVGDSLKLMGLSVDTLVDATMAREVAQRDGGIRAVLVGSVERIGPAYILGVDLLNPSDGSILLSLSEESSGQDELLPAIRDLSIRVRESLGEARPAAQAGDESLSRVSTRSLRALQLFSRADKLLVERSLGGPDRSQIAEGLLREAIVEDPEFASAYTHLAWALQDQHRPPEEYLLPAERAFQMAGGATVTERYFISASYYSMRSVASGDRSDIEAALAQYQALLQMDPGHRWAIGATIGLLRTLGRGEQILEHLLRLVEARPNDIGTLSRAAQQIVLAEGDLDKAGIYVQRARELKSEYPVEASHRDPFLEFYPVHESWVAGDVEGVLREIDRILESLSQLPAAERATLANTAAGFCLDLGMFERAEALYALYTGPRASLMAWRRGDKESIREMIHARRDWQDPSMLAWDAQNLAQLGYVDEAQEFLDALPQDFDLDKGALFGARGIIHLAHGRYEEAIRALDVANFWHQQEDVLSNYFHDARLLSRAWEAVGDPEQGLKILEEASRQKPRVLRAKFYWLELQLRLAELYREVGRHQKALEIEDELRRYSAYADPDFPILVELEARERLTDPPPR